MTLNNGSKEEIRAILFHLWNKYEITLGEWTADCEARGIPVSISTFHRLLKYGKIGELKLIYLREYLKVLKQKYPKELECLVKSPETPVGLPAGKRTI